MSILSLDGCETELMDNAKISLVGAIRPCETYKKDF
jgi:hypothetical protein